MNLKNKNLTTLVKALFLILILGSALPTSGQQQENITIAESKTYLGLGLGINDYGAGIGIELPMHPNATVFGNLGLGGWGYKIGAGITYYPKMAPYGPGFSLGYAMATGLMNFETEMMVKPNDNSQQVMLDLHNVGTINLMYSYGWTLGRTGKFTLSLGYAIPVSSNPYELKTPGVELSEVSEQVLKFMQPGGFIFGMKFMFGM